MAIEHFERPFTDDEAAELSRHIALALKELQTSSALKKQLNVQHLAISIAYSAFLLLALFIFWLLKSLEPVWVVLAGLALLFYWWGYPGKIYT